MRAHFDMPAISHFRRKGDCPDTTTLRTISETGKHERMLRRTAILATLATTLGGCSYEYELLGVVRDGRIVFVIDPKSTSAPTCLRRIEVSAEGERTSIWRDSVDYDDDCANKFPIPFGSKLKGRHQPEWPTIESKPLERGVIYEVLTTTGATGYGSGRFLINASGQVVNLNFSNETIIGNATIGR